MNQSYQQYRNNAVLTANPAELTAMLYNGAIKFCNLAIEALQNNQLEIANKNCIKAQNIIAELQMTLDMRYSFSDDVSQLYTFINQLLLEGNVEKNVQKLEDALNLIREFRDLWQEVISASKLSVVNK
ncbi:MAG: flagellar export chaperone FliS [Cellulosilyticaceae bacterium]